MTRPFAAGIVIMLSAVTAAAFAQASPAGDPVAGKRVFVASGCSTCHGISGQGGGFAGPRLAPGPFPLPMMLAQLRHPRGTMPPYSAKVLPDRAALDIHAYLTAVAVGKSAADIPLLNH